MTTPEAAQRSFNRAQDAYEAMEPPESRGEDFDESGEIESKIRARLEIRIHQQSNTSWGFMLYDIYPKFVKIDSAGKPVYVRTEDCVDEESDIDSYQEACDNAETALNSYVRNELAEEESRAAEASDDQ